MRRDELGPAVVERVAPRSPAGEAGIKPGDRIWSIDGEPMRDLIDCFLLLADDDNHSFSVERDGLVLEVEVDMRGREVGLSIERPVFGRMFTCRNNCMFCFVDQMPEGLDNVFYVKDDDYRLSFLGGNFITLTNLRREDLRRIIDERLSPLYVSLHATDPVLRRRVFGGPAADKALPALRALLDSGHIEVHLQLVLMRGVNDGERLEDTLSCIRSEYGGVSSIGVVPVGITTTGRRSLPRKMGYDGASASCLLEQVERWGSTLGPGMVFAADEFYYLAGREVPPAVHYGQYHQLENGIGLARSFREEFESAAHGERDTQEESTGTTIVTTPMGAWTLAPLELRQRYGVSIVEVLNTLFGSRVNACGLMPGKDVIAALAGATGIERVLIPGIALREENVFLDGVTIDDVRTATGLAVEAVLDDGGSLYDSLTGRS